MSDILQTVMDGVMVGGLYASVAVGITLVFGILGVLNFAHGQSVMLGAYVAYFAVRAGWGFAVALVLAMAAMAVFSGLMEQLVFRRVRNDHMAGLTASLGLIMIIENVSAAVLTPNERTMDPPLAGSVEVLGFTFGLQRLLVLAVVLALVGSCYVFLQRTRVGKSVRAMGENRIGASLVGIRTARVSLVIFMLGGAMAGAAGGLYASLFAVNPYMASAPLMKGFILTVLGGLGSVLGAVAAGFLLGLAESFGSRYLSASFRDGYGFILMIACLLFFPRGLFGGRGKDRV